MELVSLYRDQQKFRGITQGGGSLRVAGTEFRKGLAAPAVTDDR